MKRLLLLALAALLTVPTSATAQDDEERYAEFYGDGIRAYTESRYEDALTHLYRAFAIRQNAYALKLIVRAHDFQGNCSARERAAGMLGELFPAQSVPPAQRCYRTGTLHLQCERGTRDARIDGSFDVPCGSTMELPVGRHRVVSGDNTLVAEVREGTRTVAAMTAGRSYFGEPARSRAARSQTHPSILRQDLLQDPDMPSSFRFRQE